MAKNEKQTSAETQKTDQGGSAGTSVAARMLLKGPMPEIRRMKLTELRDEVQMWRKLQLLSYIMWKTSSSIGSSPLPLAATAAAKHLELGPIRSTLLRG